VGVNIDRLGQWLGLLANFGVVAGIVFLAIEVRQNQAILEQGQELMERDFALQVIDGLRLIADSADDKRILRIQSEEITQLWLDGLKGRNLDENSAQRFRDLCEMHVWNNAILYEGNIVLGEDELSAAQARVLGDQMEEWPGMKACWESQEDGLRTWGLASVLDNAISVGLETR
jgi:hypothetical protein